MTVKKRLGEMLLEAGVIDETQLHAALGHQRKWGGKLGQALLDLKLATEPQIVSALSRKFDYSAIELAALPRTPQLEAALKLVPRELALRQTLLPVASDTSSITVAMADPSNIAVVDELSFRTGRRITIVLAGDREIAAAVRRLYYAEEEPAPISAIALEELSTDSPFEPTRDPFSDMPDDVRDGYLKPPPRAPASDSDPVVRGGPQMQPAPAAPTLVLLPAAPDDLLGEPILATDLAPVEEEEPSRMADEERQLTPRQSAMLDALERASRGEESGFVKNGQLAAALARLLLKHGLLTEQDLLDELMRK